MLNPDYDKYLVAFSGGKDSICCFLQLLEMGVPLDRVELHHHLVDGREGSTLFDWPITEDYCVKFSKEFKVPIFFSWLEGGLEREMCRNETPKARTFAETPDGLITVGGKGKDGTRRKFPAKSADLSVCWCSAYAKIDVMSASITNQKRFYNSRTLVITGERAAESAARANYKEFEVHRADRRDGRSKRLVDHWRPVHKMTDEDVWKLIEKHKVNVHPAYHLGFGRLSCMRCIFSSPSQWATNMSIAPRDTQAMIGYEQEFSHTIDNKLSIEDQAAKGSVYPAVLEQPELVELANSKTYTQRIILDQGEWQLPAGAFGEQNGSI